MSTITSADDVAWDLEPLVDGDGAAGADRLLDEADRRADAFAAEHAGKVAELDGAGPRRRDGTSWREISELVGRAGSYASLRFSVDTADPANGALMQRVQERGTADRDEAAVLRARVGRPRRRRAPRSCSTPTGSRRSRHHLRTARRYRPHLLTEPEEKILAEKSVTGRDAWSRLFDELTSAIEVDAAEAPTSPSRSTSRSRRCTSPDREMRAHDRRGRHRRAASPACAPAATSSTRCCTTRPPTTGCATTRPGSRAATSPTRPPTSRSRRWSRRSATPTSCRAAGTASRRELLGRRPPRRLRPHGRRSAARTSSVDWDEAREHRARLVRRLLRRAGRHRAARSSTSAGSTRRSAPAKRGGAFCAYTVPSRAPVRDAQLHVQAPRRADARARARPRPARRARARPRRLRAAHAADASPRPRRCSARRSSSAACSTRPRRRSRRLVAAGREHRGLDRHRLPPGRDEPLRGPRAHRAPRARASSRRAHRRAVGRVPGGAARRRRRGHRRLPHVVVLRPPLHRHARLRLRLRLRPAAGAVGLRPLPRRGRGLRPALPRDARARAARSSPEDLAAIAGPGPHRPGLLAVAAWTSCATSSSRPRRPPRRSSPSAR